ncbi:hypothetical protein, variant [Aphanomyces astaci]|uniref:Uncharacterized protein n=1 Tax=Aphanomyces astaci TaxID=112090 RepID=W4GAB5_APHAT|nr:hypothetical protein, variant [Aphanomyces astaci]ETV76595.1 hypothetical protein, variant [Aphanomyces astaci]|eukprot:XP_009834140.1 hypothetical protein, variant [Aphanomyces astaci]
MARGSTKAELEAEVEKLREYKTLTKLRMKQAAEKLGSYRVQLEECKATIESLKESVTSQHQTIEHQAKTIRALTDKVAAMEASESTPAATPAAPPMTHLESAAIRSDPWLSLASSDNDEPDTNNGATATAAASSDDDSSSSGSSSSTTSDESDVETQPAAHPETTSLFGQNKQISSPPFSHPATSLFPSPTHATPNTDIKPVVAAITQQSFDTPNHTSPSTPCAKPAASPSKSAASSSQSSAAAPPRSPPTQTTASMPKDTARPHATTITTTTTASFPRKRALCPGDSKEDTMSPPLKAAKTTSVAGAPSATPPPTELVALSSALQKPMAKHMRAELVIQAYLTALRTSDDPTTRALCLTKTVKNLVAHHHVPVPAIAAAVLKIGSKSVIESTVCVDLLWQVTHPRRADLLLVLHAIGSHVRKTFNRHNTQVQASWCRVHVLLCRRATWIAASRSFLVDRLLEVNRSIWDFVTMVQSWPQIFAQLGDGDDDVTAAATSSLLPTTIRFLVLYTLARLDSRLSLIDTCRWATCAAKKRPRPKTIMQSTLASCIASADWTRPCRTTGTWTSFKRGLK